jgi:hypothetical protein
MPRHLVMNNFTSAWKHYRDNVLAYTCDDGTIEFRYEDTDNGDTINVVINYVETTNNDALHEMIRTIINDLPIDQTLPTNVLSSFGTIIFKEYRSDYETFGLDTFVYGNKRFVKRNNDCVMVTIDDE